MAADETARRFSKEIYRVIEYYRAEYDLTLATAVGALQIIAYDLVHEHCHEDDTFELPDEHESSDS